jgi:V/A-type H+-transporting ATPase subunit A
LSEPVTTNTLRVAKVFWGLDASLAYKRHYPAINWLTSYSLYGNDLNPWFAKNVHPHFPEWKKEAQSLLQRESKLEELVRLVGIEALSATEQFLLMVTRSLREDYLQQIAFDEIDSYCAPQKQALMLGWIMSWFHEGTARILKEGAEALNVLRQDQFWVAYGRAKQRSFEDLLNEELIPVSLRSEFKH